jgi:type II secretory ATPase GspE/PulE/Tfp pilus assembly ATPase PilB-like protein
MGKRCIAHIKGMAGMDVTERRRPLDGRWIFERKNGETIDLRISTLPTLYGEDCTIRFLLRQTQLLSLDHLGLMQRDHNYLLQLLNNPSGLILVTGPTGSGKTTTLYGCVSYLNNGQRKINTIEDPIEYALVRVRQSQINPMINVGFADLLRGVLRQAPDVIMIGEVRDVETAAIAVRAANSGHLVLATMHAPIAAAAVQSMLTFGIHPYQLASCLLGSIAQRLVRTLDPKTKVPYDMSMAPGTFDEVKRWLAPGDGEVIYGPRQDEHGNSQGYIGRTGVFEVMPVTRDLRQLIMQQQPTGVLRKKAIDEGMIEMRQAALLKVARGDTSIEEVFRAIPSEYLNVED